MAFVNVKRDVTDQFYRYKMPLLIAKVETACHTHAHTLTCACTHTHTHTHTHTLMLCVSDIQVEGKGNGIKTVVVNMVDVAKALCRPPSCESQHMLCLLCCNQS